MVAAKKLAVVAAMLCLALGVIFGFSAASLVHAEEVDGSTVSSAQVDSSAASGSDEAGTESEVVFVEEELPMADAKVSVLEAQTESKGMPSLLGFVLVAAAAAVTGIAVALRAKFGSKKRSYVPAKDLTLLKLKK